MFFRKLVVLIIFFICFACGKNQNNSKNIQLVDSNKVQTLDYYVKRQYMSKDTPLGVGGMIYRSNENGQFDACTWFLIGPNLAMTSSHCLPDEVKENPTINCDNYIQGKIQTTNGPQTAKCKKVIFYSETDKDQNKQNDYALIELNESVTDHFFTLGRKGVSEGQKVRMFTMNHEINSQGGVVSTYREFNCMINSSHLYGVVDSSGSSPVAAFKEKNHYSSCKGLKGNAGAPVINGSGEVIGVMNGQVNRERSLSITSIPMEQVTDHVSLFTNLRCLKIGIEDWDSKIPIACLSLENRQDYFSEESIKRMIDSEIESAKYEVSKERPDYLKYDIDIKQMDDWTYSLIPSIRCVLPKSKWSQSSLDQITSSGMIITDKEIKDVIKSYILRVSVKMNYYGKIEVNVTKNRTGHIAFTLLELEDLENDGYVEGKFRHYSLSNEITNLPNKKITVCQ